MDIEIHGTVTVDLHGCRNWFMMLWKCHKLEVIDNKVLRAGAALGVRGAWDRP